MLRILTLSAMATISAIFFLPTSARGEIRHYSIVEAQSQIVASGNVAGLAIVGQGSNNAGLSTTYSGMISADRTPGGISFLNTISDPTIADASVSGTWQPAVGGGAGSAAADYGGKINLGTTNVAVRDLVGTISSSEIAVSAGSFDLSTILFTFIGDSAIDYNYNIFLIGSGSGRESLVGPDFVAGLAGIGTISAANFVETLTLPIDVTIPFQDLNGISILDGELTLTGQIVAQATLPAIPGDFNGDGEVDGADFASWQSNFPKSGAATLGQGDADGDGDVDGADFVVWQTHFPTTSVASAQPVPEPAAIMLAMAAMAAAAILGTRLR